MNSVTGRSTVHACMSVEPPNYLGALQRRDADGGREAARMTRCCYSRIPSRFVRLLDLSAPSGGPVKGSRLELWTRWGAKGRDPDTSPTQAGADATGGGLGVPRRFGAQRGIRTEKWRGEKGG